MATAVIYTATVLGVDAHIIEVEADVSIGLGGFQIVGLPDHAIRESRERVTASLSNTAGGFPIRRVIVNLAPASLSKTGSGFDLPIALAILKADGRLPKEAGQDMLFIGELSLQGTIRPVFGVLAMLLQAKEQGIQSCIVSKGNAAMAGLIPGMTVYVADSIKEIIDFYTNHKKLEIYQSRQVEYTLTSQEQKPSQENRLDFSDVRGHTHAKRALEIAASGRHHILLTGPPGSGKSMLAKRFSSILPPLSYKEVLEVAKIASLRADFTYEDVTNIIRPFRAPHHSISGAGLVGGGNPPRAGEISLANRGVLFLDELAEYSRATLDLLRQPLEDKQIVITRAKDSYTFPANFQLITATNPCPCGYLGDSRHACKCSITQISRYRSRLSGPFLDRIDLQIEIPVVSYEDMQEVKNTRSSQQMKEHVMLAYKTQQERYQSEYFYNAFLTPSQIKKYCKLDQKSKSLLAMAVNKLKLSGRGYDSVLKISRTIADLEQTPSIQIEHIAEALQYRNLDRDLEF